MLMMKLAHIPVGGGLAPGILIFFDPGFGYYLPTSNTQVSDYFVFIKPIRNLNRLIWFVVFFMFYITAWYKLKEREL